MTRNTDAATLVPADDPAALVKLKRRAEKLARQMGDLAEQADAMAYDLQGLHEQIAHRTAGRSRRRRAPAVDCTPAELVEIRPRGGKTREGWYALIDGVAVELTRRTGELLLFACGRIEGDMVACRTLEEATAMLRAKPSALTNLVYRLREELAGAGLDRRLLERRRDWLRFRARKVVIQEPPPAPGAECGSRRPK
jgi:hypothetical protein